VHSCQKRLRSCTRVLRRIPSLLALGPTIHPSLLQYSTSCITRGEWAWSAFQGLIAQNQVSFAEREPFVGVALLFRQAALGACLVSPSRSIR
jgi:hypothetical protein